MKKLLLFAFAVPSLIIAQETTEDPQKKYTVSANMVVSAPAQFGVSVEYRGKAVNDEKIKSGLFNLSAAAMTLEGGGLEVTGSGFVIDLGSRLYWNKQTPTGFYSENFITYGNIKFDEMMFLTKFEGTYSYWSIINPNIGYKIMLGNHIALDPSIGFNWKWEVKGKGDVDNRYIDNLIWKAGLKLGYSW